MNWFDVVDAIGMGGSEKITKISDNRYVGLASFTPHFKDEGYPETVEITWSPEAFNSISNDLAVEGDWSFAFSLNRLEGDIQLLNKTVQKENVSFTLQSIEFTDVSTVISYEQVIKDELLKEWESVTPVFHVTDDLGNVYMNGTGGGGKTEQATSVQLKRELVSSSFSQFKLQVLIMEKAIQKLSLRLLSST